MQGEIVSCVFWLVNSKVVWSWIKRLATRRQEIKPICIKDTHYYDEWTDTWHTETKRLI